MVPVPEAYRQAGYTGSDQARSELRRSADVDARISWLLQDRVRADTEARHKGEKKLGDLRTRVMRELERLAFSDVRDLIQWDRVPVLANDGSVQGYRDELVTTPSRHLTTAQAASIRSVTIKAGTIKLDAHDKLNALTMLAKSLGLFQDAAPPASVTVNTINLGDTNSLEVARRLAFIMGSAASSVSSSPMIEGEAVKAADPSE